MHVAFAKQVLPMNLWLKRLCKTGALHSADQCFNWLSAVGSPLEAYELR